MLVFASIDEFENNISYYSNRVRNGDSIYIKKNDKPYFIYKPITENDTPYTDALIGGVKGHYDYYKEKDEYLKNKHQHF